MLRVGFLGRRQLSRSENSHVHYAAVRPTSKPVFTQCSKQRETTTNVRAIGQLDAAERQFRFSLTISELFSIVVKFCSEQCHC